MTQSTQNHQDFLLELGCEELPAQSLPALAQALKQAFLDELTDVALAYGQVSVFATPRRLALWVQSLQTAQEERYIERQGPLWDKAFQDDGAPTVACLGFAKSNDVLWSDLKRISSPKGDRVACQLHKKGQLAEALLPHCLERALAKLVVGRTMRWGQDHSFVRPVRWLLMLLGSHVVPATLFGLAAGGYTYGHRFHHNKAMPVSHPDQYVQLLYDHGKVMADTAQRRKTIAQQLQAAVDKGHVAKVDEALLQEVTHLVEWPVVFRGQFDKDFLQVPQEALITSMQSHQKVFPVLDDQGCLQPYFLGVTAIESKAPDQIVVGNERVIHARLSDALFFYRNDLKLTLDEHGAGLAALTFARGVGSVADKTKRLELLMVWLSGQLGLSPEVCVQAARGSKCDLLTDMVQDFPSLQGVMGGYYAAHHGACVAVSKAIGTHYLPRFSQDELPATLEGRALSLADKVDTLVAVVGIHKGPTGDKDPFALRRAALAVVRLLIECQLPVRVDELLAQSQAAFVDTLPNQEVLAHVQHLLHERLKSYMAEQGLSLALFAAVQESTQGCLSDAMARAYALQSFMAKPQAQALAAAHKRVNNLLKKYDGSVDLDIAPALFELPEEQQLYLALLQARERVIPLCFEGNYPGALVQLSGLKTVIDSFFDKVMVHVEVVKVRDNRVMLLVNLRALFEQVADLSCLN